MKKIIIIMTIMVLQACSVYTKFDKKTYQKIKEKSLPVEQLQFYVLNGFSLDRLESGKDLDIKKGKLVTTYNQSQNNLFANAETMCTWGGGDSVGTAEFKNFTHSTVWRNNFLILNLENGGLSRIDTTKYRVTVDDARYVYLVVKKKDLRNLKNKSQKIQGKKVGT